MKLLSTLTLILTFCLSYSSEPILITESTLSLDSEQSKELYFSFTEGDIIVFNLEMIKGKHIKELEVIEMPSNTLFAEFKTQGVLNKRIKIKNKGVYKFRFYSSSLTRRVCKIKVYRIPANESTRNFNTNWKWQTKIDTTYTAYQEDSLIGYQINKYKEIVKELKETKIEEVMLFNKSQRVHSFYNENKSRTYLKVDLPLLNNTSELRKENLIAWSYWIGVDQEGKKAFEQNIDALSTVTKSISSVFTSPLGALALGEVPKLIIPQTGEDVQYYFIEDYENAQLFYNNQQFLQFDKGKGKAAYGRNDRLKEGVFYIGLLNDNKLRGIDVEVKVLAIKEVKIYENVTYDIEKEEPQYVTLQKTRMNVNKTQIRVPIE